MTDDDLDRARATLEYAESAESAAAWAARHPRPTTGGEAPAVTTLIPVLINAEGCDANSDVVVWLTREQLEGLEKVATAINAASTSSCFPVLEVDAPATDPMQKRAAERAADVVDYGGPSGEGHVQIDWSAFGRSGA